MRGLYTHLVLSLRPCILLTITEVVPPTWMSLGLAVSTAHFPPCGVGVGPAVGVDVAVGVGVAVGVAVSPGSGTGVGVAVFSGSGSGVGVAVSPGSGSGSGVGVAGSPGSGSGVGVAVSSGSGSGVGVAVSSGSGSGVGVAVSSGSGSGVGVAVGAALTDMETLASVLPPGTVRTLTVPDPTEHPVTVMLPLSVSSGTYAPEAPQPPLETLPLTWNCQLLVVTSEAVTVALSPTPMEVESALIDAE